MRDYFLTGNARDYEILVMSTQYHDAPSAAIDGYETFYTYTRSTLSTIISSQEAMDFRANVRYSTSDSWHAWITTDLTVQHSGT